MSRRNTIKLSITEDIRNLAYLAYELHRIGVLQEPNFNQLYRAITSIALEKFGEPTNITNDRAVKWLMQMGYPMSQFNKPTAEMKRLARILENEQ